MFPLGPGDVFTPTGGFFRATGFPLVTYIAFAWKIPANQMQYLLPQLPKWANEEHFDIQARAEGNPGKDEMRLMMRALLADRFALAMHNETRQMPVFAVVLAKPGTTGPQLRPHNADAPCPSDPHSDDPFPAICGGVYPMQPSEPGRIRLGARNVTPGLIENAFPTRELGHPVLDRTGLTGLYDFSLEWTPERLGPDAAAEPETGAALHQALKEQLGLKLESTKAAIEILVLDRVEHPAGN
jgi:uncharacterized protein (TIGR03435 family)